METKLRCPACGDQTKLTTAWHDAEEVAGTLDSPADGSPAFLECECNFCGYEWNQPPLYDLSQPPIAAAPEEEAVKYSWAYANPGPLDGLVKRLEAAADCARRLRDSSDTAAGPGMFDAKLLAYTHAADMAREVIIPDPAAAVDRALEAVAGECEKRAASTGADKQPRDADQETFCAGQKHGLHNAAHVARAAIGKPVPPDGTEAAVQAFAGEVTRRITDCAESGGPYGGFIGLRRPGLKVAAVLVGDLLRETYPESPDA